MPEADLRNVPSVLAGATSPGTESHFAFDDFLGTWDVFRVIIDHLTGAVNRFSGKAIITASEFVETGEVRYGAVSLKANRRYGLNAGAGQLDIEFADGRPFISLNGEASQTVRHLCGDDDYRGRFVFAHAGAWIEAWHVSGPRKRYASLARYSRDDI
jgi:hypothetical protein